MLYRRIPIAPNERVVAEGRETMPGLGMWWLLFDGSLGTLIFGILAIALLPLQVLVFAIRIIAGQPVAFPPRWIVTSRRLISYGAVWLRETPLDSISSVQWKEKRTGSQVLNVQLASGLKWQFRPTDDRLGAALDEARRAASARL